MERSRNTLTEFIQSFLLIVLGMGLLLFTASEINWIALILGTVSCTMGAVGISRL